MQLCNSHFVRLEIYVCFGAQVLEDIKTVRVNVAKMQVFSFRVLAVDFFYEILFCTVVIARKEDVKCADGIIRPFDRMSD